MVRNGGLQRKAANGNIEYYTKSSRRNFCSEWIAHSPQGDMTYEAFIQFNIAFVPSFPDVNCTIEDQIGEGDKVVTHLTMRGIHLGPYRGIPPTGNKVEISGVSIGRFAGGKAIEGWLFSDSLGMMQQLAVFLPGSSK